jgi:hypothetical protein
MTYDMILCIHNAEVIFSSTPYYLHSRWNISSNKRQDIRMFVTLFAISFVLVYVDCTQM